MSKLRNPIRIALLGVLWIFVLGSLSLMSLDAKAATTEQLNDPSVFLKQQGGDTCTLCANTMMLRRASLMRGDNDWDTITEGVMRPRIWIEGAGMCYEYEYKGFSVNFGKTANPYNSEGELIDLLSRHPEGIVAYDYDYPHAILLTDYTDGVFYCAEPANNIAPGRIEASQALVNVSGIEAYWYIENASFTGQNGFTAAENLSSLSSDDVILGESVKINAKASGGSDSFLYSFYVQSLSDNQTSVLQESGSSRRVTFRPSAAGSYRIIVNASDRKTGIVSRKSMTLQVHQPLRNASVLSSDTLMLRRSLTIKGAASGGSGAYTYEFYVRTPVDKDWTKLCDDSKKSSVVYTPSAATNYEFLVIAKDQQGRTAKKTLKLSVTKPLENRSGAASYRIVQGGSLRLTASASGGSGDYQYAFYCRKAETKGWYIIKLYGSENEASYSPSDAAEYDVLLCVKDSAGTVSKKSFRVTVAPALTNRSSVSSQTVTKGGSVRLSGAADGGTEHYSYAFYFRKAETAKWKTIRAYSQVTTAEFKPATAGSYELLVRVKDSSGTTEGKIFPVTVEKSS